MSIVYDVGNGIDGDLTVAAGDILDIAAWYNTKYGPNTYNPRTGAIPKFRNVIVAGTITCPPATIDGDMTKGTICFKVRDTLRVTPTGVISAAGKGREYLNTQDGYTGGTTAGQGWDPIGTTQYIFVRPAAPWFCFFRCLRGSSGASSRLQGGSGTVPPASCGGIRPGYDDAQIHDSTITPPNTPIESPLPRSLDNLSWIHGSGGGFNGWNTLYQGPWNGPWTTYNILVPGGTGGGYIDIAAFELINEGSITANGLNGASGWEARGAYNHETEDYRYSMGGAGGGAGGRVRLIGTNLKIGINKVSSKGGRGGTGSIVGQSKQGKAGDGGFGGDGLVELYFSNLDGQAQNVGDALIANQIPVPPVILRKTSPTTWDRISLSSAVEMENTFKRIKEVYVEINGQLKKC